MARRRVRGAARRAGGRRVDEDPARTTSATTTYIAARLLGDNPRLPVAVNGDAVAMLKLEPAAPVRHYFSRRGEKAYVGGVVGAAMVVEDPDGLLDFDESGRLRLRVFSPAELRRFALRLLEYAELLEVANVVGVDLRVLRESYFGGGSQQPRDRRRRHVAEPAMEEDSEIAEEEEYGLERENVGGFEEVEIA